MKDKRHQVITHFIKGMGMGAADLVPGVSGGTIAIILGIYPTLIESLSRFDAQLLRYVLAGKMTQGWVYIHGRFLLALGLGVITSVLLLAHVISFLLEQHAYFLWSFFCGLIISSIVHLLGYCRFTLIGSLAFMLGIFLCIFLGLDEERSLGYQQVTSLMYFFSALIAICGMLLPGISGSFILLLMGVYAPVLQAVKQLDIAHITVFGLGAICGLLMFSKVIHWLLQKYYDGTMLFLTGLLIGSLALLWPWKSDFTEMSIMNNLWPWQVASLTSTQQFVMLLFIVLGVGCGLMLAKSNVVETM